MIANDIAALRRVDRLLDSETPPDELSAALDDHNWQVQQAALQAVGMRRVREAVPSILRLLERQDQLGLYGAPEPWSLDGAPDPATRDAWRCRFRVKQAACHALGAIGRTHGDGAVGADAVERLASYARSREEDFCVRAAACQALGRMQAAAARDALLDASRDEEWCTATEAAKALAAIDGQSRE